MRMYLVAVLCCFAYPSSSVVAEEEIKYQSPNGAFGLRIVQPKDDEYHRMIDLIEKDSGKALVNLHDGSDSAAFDPSECILVWSADSRRVAYGFAPIHQARGWLTSGRLCVFGMDPVPFMRSTRRP